MQEYYHNEYSHLFYGKVQKIGRSNSEVKSLTGWFTNSGISIYWIYNLSIGKELEFKPFQFDQAENLGILMADSLPRSLNKITAFIEFIENYNSENMGFMNELLNE